MWVILCRLPEKGRKEIEEVLEKMKGWTGGGGGGGVGGGGGGREGVTRATGYLRLGQPSIHVHYGGIIALFTEVK